jgi:hypothetical protein
MLLNLSVTKPSTLVILGANFILLVIMFIGLLYNHMYERSTYGIGRLLWKQVECHHFRLKVVFSIS